MRTLLLILLAVSTAPALLAQERIVIEMEPVTEPGPFQLTWTGAGPATDPIGGQFDPLEDSISGIPAGLTGLDVRFEDLQQEEAYRMGYLKGNVKKADYDHMRRLYGASRAPDSIVFDQRLDYAVGKDSDGHFAVVFDTDNDEDLSDETIHRLPWDGPPTSMKEFSDSVLNAPRYDELVAGLPSISVQSEVLIDGQVVPIERSVLIMPFLHVPSPGPGVEDRALYLIGYGEYRRGSLKVDELPFDIWAHAHRALFRPNSSLFRVVEPDAEQPPAELTNPLHWRNYGLGEVIALGTRKFRIDRISMLGDRLELVDVTDRSLAGSGTPAPPIAGKLVGGGSFDLAAVEGKYVLLNFWSPDCSGCFDDRMNETYATIDKSCIEFVGIGEGSEDEIRNWTRARGISWKQIADMGGGVSAAYGVSRYPTDVLVNPSGEVAAALDRFGPSSRSDMLHAALPPACFRAPTLEEIMSAVTGEDGESEPTDYYIEGCSFLAEDVAVRSIGDRDPAHGWPVTLDVSGQCTGHEGAARQGTWHQELTLNIWLYQSMGEWMLVAREPFVVVGH